MPRMSIGQCSMNEENNALLAQHERITRELPRKKELREQTSTEEDPYDRIQRFIV